MDPIMFEQSPELLEFSNYLTMIVPIIILLGIWSLIWKGIALWKCGRNNQIGWYIAILILNTLGILPIIYILFFQDKKGN